MRTTTRPSYTLNAETMIDGEAMTTEVQFADVVAVTPRFLEGKVRGRILVPVNLQLG